MATKENQTCEHTEQKVMELPKPKLGILIANTGTPAGFTYFPLCSFLAEFLSDRRMIELPRIIWYPILYLFILPTRPFKKRKDYMSIWNWETNESPLRTFTRSQATQLTQRLQADNVEVEWAFRYGGPTIESGIQALKNKGCDRLLLLPLFPQYAAATTASVVDETFRCLQLQRHQMALRTVPPYYCNKLYLSTIAKTILRKVSEAQFQPEVLIFSYHGIPLKCQELGDPYGAQCHETSRLLREHLPYDCQYVTAFQSRFGGGEWLKPYTMELVVRLARLGIKRLMILAPGFICDCLETVEEIEVDMGKIFLENGGEQFAYVPCMNDSAETVDLIESLVRTHSQNFLI